MRLDQHAVDLFEVDFLGVVADGFEQGAEAEVAGAANDPLAGADDQVQRFLAESVVAEVLPTTMTSYAVPKL